jgi:hypothetical protein
MLYVKSKDVLIAQIARDITDEKRILARQRINVQADGVAKYRYSCSGYEVKFEITRDKAKAESSTRIAGYIADIIESVTLL